jgi:ATP-dependent Lon protease
VPRENAKDLKELPAHVRKSLHVTLAETMDEVLREALARYDFGETGARHEYDLEELLAGAPPREATAH